MHQSSLSYMFRLLLDVNNCQSFKTIRAVLENRGSKNCRRETIKPDFALLVFNFFAIFQIKYKVVYYLKSGQFDETSNFETV